MQFSSKHLLFLSIYCIFLFGDIYALSIEHTGWHQLLKCGLMPILMIWVTTTPSNGKSYKIWMIVALFASWVGDVFLLFEKQQPIFFIIGLLAFLLGHLAYILFFAQLQTDKWQQNGGMNTTILPFLLLYQISLLYLLWNNLKQLRFPVMVYATVLLAMLWMALQKNKGIQKTSALLFGVGAILFVLSDSILAINKFYHPFEIAEQFIMISYGLAQLLLVGGMIYHTSKKIGQPVRN